CQSPSGPYCSLQTATGTSSPSDEAVLTPGNYTPPSGLTITGVNVPGQVSQPSATITSGFGPALTPNTTAKLSDVRIDGSNTAVMLNSGTPVLDRVFAHSAAGPAACLTLLGTVRDSVCWNAGAGGQAVGQPGFADASTVTLRNVDAIATGTGSRG